VTERKIVDWIPFQVDMTHAQSGKIRTQTLHVLQPVNVNEPRSQTLHVVDGSSNSTAKELPKQGCDHRLQGRAFACTGPDGATGDVEQCGVLSFIPLRVNAKLAAMYQLHFVSALSLSNCLSFELWPCLTCTPCVQNSLSLCYAEHPVVRCPDHYASVMTSLVRRKLPGSISKYLVARSCWDGISCAVLLHSGCTPGPVATTFGLFGACAEFEGESERPAQDFWRASHYCCGLHAISEVLM
jgi:hypothetical protein